MSQAQIIPAGQPLPPTPNTLTPIAAVAVLPGQPLARSRTVAGQVQLASAHSGVGKISLCSGLALKAANAGERVTMVYAGTIELPTDQWDAIAGTSGGLVEGVGYYVSDTDGHLVDSPPGGLDADTFVGIAQSPTLLLLQIVSAT